VLQLKEMDISVPNDVKIICFGNNPSLEVITPSVSSIVQPITELAEASFNLLMKRIEEPDNKQFEQQIFSAKLINR
jgi:DNA-binding LacI/PurR family transcriptional regulator